MKIVLLVMLIILVIPLTANAAPGLPTIGVFLDAPVAFVNNETVRTMVTEKASKLFPANKFNLLSFDTTSNELRTFKEDHRMFTSPEYSQPVNRLDIQKIGGNLNCDYALFILINNDTPRFSSGLFSVKYKTTVTCDVRLLDINTGNYLASKQITKEGSSAAVYNVPTFDKAYKEALGKALDEFTIDTSLLLKPAI